MKNVIGSRVFNASRSFTCEHCGESIVEGAKYLRFWLEHRDRSAICMVCALTVYDADGERRYTCEALVEFVKTMREQLTPAELTGILEVAVIATACVMNAKHPAVDFMRQFALGLRRGTFEKIAKQRQEKRNLCH